MHRDCAENLPLRLADFPADKSPVCIEVDHLCSVKGDGRSMQLHATRREDMAQFAHRWHIQRATQLQIPHLVWLDFVLPNSKASYQRQVSSRADYHGWRGHKTNLCAGQSAHNCPGGDLFQAQVVVAAGAVYHDLAVWRLSIDPRGYPGVSGAGAKYHLAAGHIQHNAAPCPIY